MNVFALSHIPQSRDAFPVSRNACTVRFRTARGDVKSVDVVYKYKYNEKPIGSVPMRPVYSDALFDYYECTLPTDRGRRVYYFSLTGKDGENWYFTETGAQRPDDVPKAYFPCFQVPFVSDGDIHTVPDKWAGACIYQIFPDRFYTERPKGDWSRVPKGGDFFGGELYGAASKLDHIKSLGFDTVYLTPINPSHSSHHYDVEDYYHVSEDFGGDDAFFAFVQKAHDLGIKVILDGVFNHCSVLNPLFRDVYEKGRGSQYYDWFLIDGDKPDISACNYQTFAWHVPYMPKFNCDNEKVREFVCDVTVHWIKNYNIDGWRLDVGDDVSPALWREVRKCVKRADPNAIMIGEDWMDAHAFLRGDVFDGVMNYGFTRAMRDWLAYKKIECNGASDRLVRNLMSVSSSASRLMMNIIGTHDTHRFFSLCGENLFDFECALAAMFFFEGMPCLYYGDEIPLQGLADPDCRRGFDWSRARSDTAMFIKTLTSVRTGDRRSIQTEISGEHGALVIKRKGEKTSSLYVNNTAFGAKTDGVEVPPRTIIIDVDGAVTEHREKQKG